MHEHAWDFARIRIWRGAQKHPIFFSNLAANTSHFAGRASAFLLALFVVVIWAISGPFFNYSDTWQLVINTGTTIVTFLMVFLIQHTQNRDTRALQLKLDELIIATQGARNSMASIEEASEDELDEEKDKVKVRKRATDQEQRNWEADPARDKWLRSKLRRTGEGVLDLERWEGTMNLAMIFEP